MHPRAIVERKAAAQERIQAAVARCGPGFSLRVVKNDDPDIREMLVMEQVADLLEALAGNFASVSGKTKKVGVTPGSAPGVGRSIP